MDSPNKEYPPQIAVSICRFFVLAISKIVWRIEFRGVEHIPRDLKSGLIIASNHQTYIDPFWVSVKVKRKMRYMAWDEAFNWFLLGRLMTYYGAFPVGLNRRGFVKASRKAMETLKENATLVIFPEAEREFSDGKMLPFKNGAIRLAMEAEVPILPVTIRGANKVWAQDIKFPRFGRVEIIYHPLMQIPKPANEQNTHSHIEKLNTKLKNVISSELA